MCKDFLCQLSKKLGCTETIVIETERIVYVEEIPILEPCGTISIDEASSICLDVIEQYGNRAELYLPDLRFKVYNYSQVVTDESLAWVDTLVYSFEDNDCDDFGRKLFGKWACLAWSDVHALNWFISEEGKFWFIEPQTRQIADKLDRWQGKSLRFLLGA